MAHYSVYDTEAAPSTNAEGYPGVQNFPPLKAKEVWTGQPTQTDFAEFVTGSVYADQAGKLEIQQSFDYPQNHENEEKAIEKAHWDAITTITLKAKENEGFQIFALAPYFRLVYTNGEVEQKVFRVFARAQEKGRV
jgi:hypothetical protein